MQKSLDITNIKANLTQKISSQVQNLEKIGVKPRLDIICVGNNINAIKYAELNQRNAESLGIIVNIEILDPTKHTQQDLINLILTKNYDPKIHGIMLGYPFVEGFDFDAAYRKIIYTKDVDGLGPNNTSYLLANNYEKGIQPATPQSCIEILGNITEIKGKQITLIGYGRTVGKPLASMLTNLGATVLICHQTTTNIPEITRQSDIIIIAIGVPDFLKADMIKPGAIIIDVGTSWDEQGKLVGDADYNNIKDIAGYISPAKLGVGTLTSIIIFQNLLKCIDLHKDMDLEISMNDFIDISCSTELPGGGSICAISAINGASMLHMVCQHSEQNQIIKDIQTHLKKTIENLKKLYSDDMNTYKDFLDTLKLPKDDVNRKEKLESLKRISCEIPLEIIQDCVEAKKLGKKILEIGNKNLFADLEIGMNLLEASIKGCIGLVEINLKMINDESLRTELRGKMERLIGKKIQLDKNIYNNFCNMSSYYLYTARNIFEKMRDRGNIRVYIQNHISENIKQRITNYESITKFSDFNVLIPTLFLFYHGIELSIKTLIAYGDGELEANHKLTNLLSNLKKSKLKETIEKYVLLKKMPQPLKNFLEENKLRNSNLFYEFLKYPTNKEFQKIYKHIYLLYQEEKGIEFAKEIIKDIDIILENICNLPNPTTDS